MRGERMSTTPRAFVRNLRQPMPLGQASSRLVVRNAALKVVRLQTCCGHPRSNPAEAPVRQRS